MVVVLWGLGGGCEGVVCRGGEVLERCRRGLVEGGGVLYGLSCGGGGGRVVGRRRLARRTWRLIRMSVGF